MRKQICLLLLAVGLIGCAAKDPGKRYPIEGDVKALDPVSKIATLAAGKVDGWMEAMTMEYPVKPDAEFAKLHVGDHIKAAIVVQGERYYVTDVKVTPK